MVHGEDGLDEISPCAGTAYARLENGAIEEGVWQPIDFGLKTLDRPHLQPGSNAQGNAAILREAISVASSPRSAAVLPSAAAAPWLAGVVDDLPTGARAARDAVANGAGARKLKQLVELSRS